MAAGTEQTGQAAAELCSPRVALSACRALTPEHLVASPFGGEQRMGRVWIALILLDPSFLQLGFPLDFHLGTISNCPQTCLVGSDSKLGHERAR